MLGGQSTPEDAVANLQAAARQVTLRGRGTARSARATEDAVRAHRPLAPYLFLVPALGVFGFAVLDPFAFTGAYSLTEWNGYATQSSSASPTT